MNRTNLACWGANFPSLNALPSMSRFAEVLASMPETPSARALNDAIQQVLASQHAVISDAQLKALGVRADSVRRRVDKFELFEVPLGRGIYTGQAGPISPEGRRRAGLLWAPPGTWLTGGSATATLGLERSQDAVVQLITRNDNESRKAAPGVKLHRIEELNADDLTVVDGVPCTKPARAMLDVAHFARPKRLDQLIKQAEDLRIYDHTSMHRVSDENPKWRGSREFRAALARVNEASDRSRSIFETKTAALLSTSPHLPKVLQNAVILGVESDLWLQNTYVVIECDGRRFHRTPQRVLRDEERDAILRAGGFAILRLLWDQVVYEPERTLARVVDFYRANAHLGSPSTLALQV